VGKVGIGRRAAQREFSERDRAHVQGRAMAGGAELGLARGIQ